MSEAELFKALQSQWSQETAALRIRVRDLESENASLRAKLEDLSDMLSQVLHAQIDAASVPARKAVKTRSPRGKAEEVAAV